jgi:hypothetical protein
MGWHFAIFLRNFPVLVIIPFISFIPVSLSSVFD